MRLILRGTLAAMISLPLFGCAHGGNVSSSEFSSTAVAPRSAGNALTITGVELRLRGATRSLFDAVASLRPSFIRFRGIRPTVVIDGVTHGPVESLNDLTVESVERIQLLSGPDATIRYGTRHTGAILLVTTRRP